jgi:hypothetical protein
MYDQYYVRGNLVAMGLDHTHGKQWDTNTMYDQYNVRSNLVAMVLDYTHGKLGQTT